MDSSITLKPLTASGEAWVRAYTHPPTEVAGVEGIPDHSTMSSTVVDFRNEFTVTPPAGVGTGTWSVLLMTTSDPEYPMIAFRWVGDTPADPIPNADILLFQNTSYNWGSEAVNWERDVSQFRPVKYSATHYFDASQLYNQGRVWASQIGMGNITHVDAPAGTTQSTNVYDIGLIPTTGGQVMQSSSKYYSGLAKDGCFQILRYIDPACQYSKMPTSVNIYQYQITPGGPIVNRQINLDRDLPSGQTLTAPAYPGLSMGFSLFKGMLNQATISSKLIHSWEVTTDVGSAWAPFAKPGPCPDGPAMDLASTEMFKLADGFPAAANDFGSFINAAKSLGPILKQVYNVAKPVLKTGLNTLPAGGLLNQILEGVEGLAMANSSQPKKKKQLKITPTAPIPMAKKSLTRAPAQQSESLASRSLRGVPLNKNQKQRLRKQMNRELALLS